VLTLQTRRHTNIALAAMTQVAAAEPVSVIHSVVGDLSNDVVLPATL
jgi:hypothetical protein